MSHTPDILDNPLFDVYFLLLCELDDQLERLQDLHDEVYDVSYVVPLIHLNAASLPSLSVAKKRLASKLVAYDLPRLIENAHVALSSLDQGILCPQPLTPKSPPNPSTNQ